MKVEIRLLKHQQEFMEAEEREIILLGAPATGKTFVQLHDAQEYALRYPGSLQIYMCDCADVLLERGYFDAIKRCGKFNKPRREFRFYNDSRLFLRGNEQRELEMCKGLDVNIFRIDIRIFDMPPRTYFEHVLKRILLPGMYPKHIKITAEDALYRFIRWYKMRIIEAEEDANYLIHLQKHAELYRMYVDGNWDIEGEKTYEAEDKR